MESPLYFISRLSLLHSLDFIFSQFLLYLSLYLSLYLAGKNAFDEREIPFIHLIQVLTICAVSFLNFKLLLHFSVRLSNQQQNLPGGKQLCTCLGQLIPNIVFHR